MPPCLVLKRSGFGPIGPHACPRPPRPQAHRPAAAVSSYTSIRDRPHRGWIGSTPTGSNASWKPTTRAICMRWLRWQLVQVPSDQPGRQHQVPVRRNQGGRRHEHCPRHDPPIRCQTRGVWHVVCQQLAGRPDPLGRQAYRLEASMVVILQGSHEVSGNSLHLKSLATEELLQTRSDTPATGIRSTTLDSSIPDKLRATPCTHHFSPKRRVLSDARTHCRPWHSKGNTGV